MSDESLDFLSSILVEGQELQITFKSYKKNDFQVSGTLTIKEQDIVVQPERGHVNHPKTLAWMRTHPKYWKILCGLEEADTRTNIKIIAMLLRAGLNELAEMMARRVETMIAQAYDAPGAP